MITHKNARKILHDLFLTGLKSADPAICVPPHLPDPPSGRTVVIAAGKAAAAMAKAVEDHWQGEFEGIAVTRYGHGLVCKKVEVIEASHPVPDNRGEIAARKLMDMVSNLGPDDLVLCLISGGGSALLGLPADGLTLGEKKAVNKALLASGAPIGEMNTVRKHLSAIKGGRLAQAAYPAQVVTLGISDVAGDDPSVIASGPTVADATTLAQARELIARYRIEVPPAVAIHLEKPSSETPKPGDPVFDNTRFVLVARPADMIEAVIDAAQKLGFDVCSLGAEIQGEARDIGAAHAQMALKQAAKMKPGALPCLIVSGGETTVTIDNDGGRGGRNCEYLLALANGLAGHPDIYALACDTDGIDGSEDNAGAIADPQTLMRAKKLGMNPHAMLTSHDSYSIFSASKDLIVTGPTLTNVNDLRLILIFPPDQHPN